MLIFHQGNLLLFTHLLEWSFFSLIFGALEGMMTAFL